MSSRLVVVASALRTSFAPVSRASPAFAARGIASSAVRQHKESDSQSPDSSLDKHKADSLQKQAQGKGHWKPELASDSEEAVRADRSGPKDSSPEAMSRLQERTKGHAGEKSKAGTSSHDGL